MSDLVELATTSCVKCGTAVTIYLPEDGPNCRAMCGRCAKAPVPIVLAEAPDAEWLVDAVAEDLLRAKICSAACMLALEPECECRCGGHFHAALIAAVVVPNRIPNV